MAYVRLLAARDMIAVVMISSDQFQRARQPAQKEDRRQLIIDTALAVLESLPYSDLTMAILAERAGLAKGTLYLYFQTKEQLLLALAEQLTARWLTEQQRHLQPLDSTGAAEQVALATSVCLLRQSALLQLLPLACSVLDQHEGETWAIDYRARLIDRAKIAGTRVESCFLHAAPGTGSRFLTCAVALATGLQQLKRKTCPRARPMPGATADDVFETSLGDELTLALGAMLRGLLSVPIPA